MAPSSTSSHSISFRVVASSFLHDGVGMEILITFLMAMIVYQVIIPIPNLTVYINGVG
jgi:hypothetical protein